MSTWEVKHASNAQASPAQYEFTCLKQAFIVYILFFCHLRGTMEDRHSHTAGPKMEQYIAFLKVFMRDPVVSVTHVYVPEIYS